HTREQAEQVKAQLAQWLQPRGLVFNEDKTQITHLERGVDFLGFAIRRYPNGKLLTKPSNDALRRIRRRLSVEVKALRGANADAPAACRRRGNSPGRCSGDSPRGSGVFLLDGAAFGQPGGVDQLVDLVGEVVGGGPAEADGDGDGLVAAAQPDQPDPSGGSALG